MVELLQIHLMTVHVTKGVAKVRVITKSRGAQRQKRKIGKTFPENFDSIYFSLKIYFVTLFLVATQTTQKNVNDVFVNKTDVLK